MVSKIAIRNPRALKIPKETHTMSYGGWWGDAYYGDNDPTPGTLAEIAAGDSGGSAPGNLSWGPTPINVDYPVMFVANDGAGNVVLAVNGRSAIYAAGPNRSIQRLSLLVSAEPGTMVYVYDMRVVFRSTSVGSPYKYNCGGLSLCSDGITPPQDPSGPPLASLDIIPPTPPNGAWNNVTFNATIHLQATAGTYPTQLTYFHAEAVPFGLFMMKKDSIGTHANGKKRRAKAH